VFFWKGLAIEVGGLGDVVAFTTLPVTLSHVNMDDYDVGTTTIWVCTHHTSLCFIAFHHTLMHAVVNQVYPIRQHVALVRQSQSMHAPCFVLRMTLSHLCFLRAPDVEPRCCCQQGCPLRFQPGQSAIL
jgi:hypothetical protein